MGERHVRELILFYKCSLSVTEETRSKSVSEHLGYLAPKELEGEPAKLPVCGNVIGQPCGGRYPEVTACLWLIVFQLHPFVCIISILQVTLTFDFFPNIRERLPELSRLFI